jgi:hypothetical protein
LKTVTSGPDDCEGEDIASRVRLAIAARVFLRFTVFLLLMNDVLTKDSLSPQEVAQPFIDHAGASGSVVLWETQLLGASQSKGA